MSELKSVLMHFTLPVILIVIILFSLIMFIRPSTIQSVEVHEMGNGISCYTFHTSIDCLQVER